MPLRAPAELGVPSPVAPSHADRWVCAAALGLAFAAHAAVLGALLREPDDVTVGGGGQQIESISVTIVSSNVLESVVAERAQPTVKAATASAEATEGTQESAPAPAAERQETKTEEDKERTETKPQEEPAVAAEALIEVRKQTRRKREHYSVAVPAAGGAAVRADAATPTAVSASAAASAGAVREYARHVSLALSRSKPRGGQPGIVRVKFVVAADGSLASAEIATSSGDGRLDASALEALRRTKFRAPPSGMTLAQLTYVVPYHFR